MHRVAWSTAGSRRIRSGLPTEPDLSQPLPKRLLSNPLFWLTVVMLLVYAGCWCCSTSRWSPTRRSPAAPSRAWAPRRVPIAAKYAAITAIPLSLLFLWADRYRPQRFWVWLMTFGWGACVATFFSAQVNTWAASQLSIIGDGDPATGARAAIYVAPWVEEAAKATVLFWLAILMRYQWVSRVSGIVLAGLSGAAFAFVENILYYGRAYRYAARTFGEVPPLEALQSLFMLRGVMTFFGHPLFTAMTGIGLAVALRSKSKVVRVVAPLAGYSAAAFLHMAFNASASLLRAPNLLLMYLFVAIPLVIGIIVFTVRQVLHEGRLIRARLGDYVRLGWLPEGDPVALSRLRTRGKALWHAIFTGPDVLLATIRLQRAATELAYLRDAMARGLVDTPGWSGRSCCCTRLRPARPRDRAARAAGPRTRRCGAGGSRGGPLPAAQLSRTGRTRRELPGAPPASACRMHRWGRLLPSTPRSTPPGSHPVRASESASTVSYGEREVRWRVGRPLETALVGLRDALTRVRLPHGPAGCGRAAVRRRRLVAQLDDYVLPRLADHRRAAARRRRRLHRRRASRRWSTRWSGRRVSAPGVIRPTTRAPVLVHHTVDARWFTGAAGAARAGPIVGRQQRHPVAAAGAPTTASRRGWPSWTPRTSTPWWPTTASSPPSCWPPPTCGCSSPPRPGTPTRCPGTSCSRPPTAARPSPSCWIGSRRGRWRRCRPPRSTDGRARARRLAAVRRAGDRRRRRGAAARRGHPADPELAGPTGRRPGQPGRGGPADARRGHRRGRPAVPEVGGALDEQQATLDQLRAEVDHSYAEAVRTVRVQTEDGTLLRGEVLARWQEFVGTGEFFRAMEQKIGWLRDRITAVFKGEPPGPATSRWRSSRGWRRCCGPRPTPPPNGPRRPGRPTPPAGSCWPHGQDLTRASPDFADAGGPGGPRLAGRGARPGRRRRDGQAVPGPVHGPRRERGRGGVDDRRLRADRRACRAPRSASRAAPPCSPSGCWRPSSATRPYAGWPPPPRRSWTRGSRP